MSQFNPEKLTVNFLKGFTSIGPILPRRYTLTHSDNTGELFLTIGQRFAWEEVNPLRDEVIGEWKTNGNSMYYAVFVYIDHGEHDQNVAAKRYEIFKRELPLALKAIRFGDRHLFHIFPYLDHVPIIVHFMSSYASFAGKENWGRFHSYRTS
ncbi:staygreen family protein [Ornithinibacillus scapharcae]|uniref:staygreen family protein n=1 Tax=Ornithinibacillus scapharcae TaxID=1147159 RepID=UPI000225ADBE|nr:staygreen family protein [Ornithinibacillus scapharcae]